MPCGFYFMNVFAKIDSAKKSYLVGILIAMGALTYSNTYQNDFLWDDEFLITENQYIQDFSNMGKMLTSNSTAGFGGKDKFYRPLQLLLYSLAYPFAHWGQPEPPGSEPSKTAIKGNSSGGSDSSKKESSQRDNNGSTGSVNDSIAPWPFHLVNNGLHLAVTLSLFFLILSLSQSQTVSFVATLLWMVHPVHTEAVTYKSATADPLHTFFVILTSLFFLKYIRKTRPRFLALSLICFALGLFSKEPAAVTPALILLILFLNNGRSFRLKQLLYTLPYWVVLGLYFVIRHFLVTLDTGYNFYYKPNVYTESILVRFWTFLATLPEYVTMIVKPTTLHMERSFPVFTSLFHWPVFLGLIGLISSLLWCSRKCLYQKITGTDSALTHREFRSGEAASTGKPQSLPPPLVSNNTYRSNTPVDPSVFAPFWFLIVFTPMCGILIPVNSLILEHWLYMSSIGYFWWAAQALTNLSVKLPKASTALLLLLVTVLMGLTLRRNTVWRNPIVFYNDILSYSKGTARVHNNLAMAYAAQSNFDLAIQYYSMAIELSDSYPQPHYNLARIYIRRKQYKKAMIHLDRSLALQPDFLHALTMKKRLLNFLNSIQKKP